MLDLSSALTEEALVVVCGGEYDRGGGGGEGGRVNVCGIFFFITLFGSAFAFSNISTDPMSSRFAPLDLMACINGLAAISLAGAAFALLSPSLACSVKGACNTTLGPLGPLGSGFTKPVDACAACAV